MSLENITFKATNTEVSDAQKALVEQKLSTLSKFIGNAHTICNVEFAKVTHHHSGHVHRLEVNLEVNGKFYRAEATMESFEKAIDEVRNDLERELKRDHQKKDTLLKRGGRKLKEMLRFGNV